MGFFFALKYEKFGLNYITENEIYKNISDRNKFNKFIKELFNIYRFMLYKKIGIFDEKTVQIETNSTKENLCEKLLIINSFIEKEKININKDLMIDKLIIDLWRCDNENCID